MNPWQAKLADFAVILTAGMLLATGGMMITVGNQQVKIVTQIESADPHIYWIAEEYHQKYLAKNPNGYDCHSSTGVLFS